MTSSTLPEAIRYKSASEIFVEHYRQILIWPLLLKLPEQPANGTDDTAAQFKQVHQLLDDSRVWRQVRTIPAEVRPAEPIGGPWGGPGPGNEPTYEEMVYFHPFVRDFLYGANSQDNLDLNRPLLRYERSDITAVELQLEGTLKDNQPPVTFQVVRTELYLCKPLIAILAIEVAWQAPPETKPKEGSEVASGELPRQPSPSPPLPSLRQALTWQTQLRQIYPPYFKGTIPGNCPDRVTWVQGCADRPTGRIESDFIDARQRFAEFVHQGAEPPVGSHWQALLAPLKPYRGDVDDASTTDRQAIFYQQIVDDRMPGMTYLAVDDPRAIHPGDMARLAYCDPPAQVLFQYAPGFLEPQLKACCYDRFWHPTPELDVPGDKTFDIRYMMSGFQFVALGASSNGFYTGLIPAHFRRMYFRLGLLAHYQRAALLKFADELSECIKSTSGKSPHLELRDAAFRKRVAELQLTLLKFKSRSWFTEVTNQLQGQELYDHWIKQLGIQELFRHVDETSDSLHSALIEFENNRLTNVATIGVPIAVALSLLALFVDFGSFLELGELMIGKPSKLELPAESVKTAQGWIDAKYIELGLACGGVVVVVSALRWAYRVLKVDWTTILGEETNSSWGKLARFVLGSK